MVAPSSSDDAVDNSKASYEAPAPCTSQVIQVPCSDWARQEGDVGCTPVHSDDGTVDTKTPSGEVQSPEVLTQHYLRLLNTGRLASREKSKREALKASSRACTAETSQRSNASPLHTRSVHTADITRLRASTRALSVTPLHPTSLPSSSSRSMSPCSDGDNTLAAASLGPDQLQPPLPQTPPSPSSSRRSTSPQEVQGHGRAGSLEEPEPPASTSSAGPRAGLQRCQPGVSGSTGELAYNHSAFCKVYGPGPGAYTPSTDRRGAWDAQSYSFGNARQRPQHVCIHDRVASPGPVYLPRTDSLSWSTSPPRYRFGRRHVGSRFDTQHDHQPSNAPHWNPGPGDYHAQMLHRSKSQHLGADAPRTVFSHAPKLVCPSLNLSATVFVSSSHAQLENAGVFSPGPAFYSPQNSLVKSAAPQHTMSAKFPTYFDLCLDPTRQLSPGPGVHDPRARDKRGTKVWGSDPRATFGKAPREWDPELRLSAAPFISHKHAQHANHGVHSPGPAQQAGREPRKAYGHITTPLLASGPRDRFFTRFEEGRVA
ncbi:hypothetical protein QJQ45_018135 [Haematococcus lacustris]|nr:hypothetical protein QJQ45_018135 [Haematococcus lacustris]